jgi:hypothetical protein
LKPPPEVPAGRTILTFTPASEVSAAAKGQSKNKAFRNALRRAYGAWKKHPQENGLSDICDLRDFVREGYTALPVVLVPHDISEKK